MRGSRTRSERRLVVGEADTVDRDDVEADVDVAGPASAQPALGEGPDLLLLRGADGRHGTTEAGRVAPGLHLAEHEQVAAASDEIEIALQFSLRRSPADVEHREAQRSQMTGGQGLTPPAP